MTSDRRHYPIDKIYWASAIVSICGITFQVLLGALGSYTLGDSVKQYAFTIGLFLSGMGVGSFASEKVMTRLMERFVQIELLIGTVGGTSSFLLFYVIAFHDYATAQWFLYSLTFLIGGLTGLELPLLIRRASEIGEKLNRSTARVLFSDYAGSLLGAVGFALLLRPWFGLIKTAFLIGTVNIAVALWMVYAFRAELRFRRLYAAMGTALFVLLSAGFLFGEDYAYGFEQKMYRDQIVRAFDTPYQRVILTKEGEDVRLYLNGNIQFSSSDEYRYHESLVHPTASLAEHRDHVLVLGGGDGLAVRELLKYPDIGRIVLVDLDRELVEFSKTDPLMTELNEGALENPKVKIVNRDAFRFLQEDRGFYDVILADLPDPNNESLNKLYTREFYGLMKQRLAPGGYAAVQATSPLFARKAYWSIDRTLEAAGFHTANYHVDIPSFGNWGFILASREPVDPQTIEVRVPTRFLSGEVIPGLFTFGKDENGDIRENGKPVRIRENTLNRPVLIEYYQSAWQRFSY